MLLNIQQSVIQVQNQKDLTLTVFFKINKTFIDTMTPGPGNYKNLANNMSNIGRYVLSNNNGGTKAIFDQSKRVTKFD